MGTPIRAFIHVAEAWYASSTAASPNTLDEIVVGRYDEMGGTFGEFTICWTLLAGNATPVLKVFDDAWGELAHFHDLLEAMSKMGKLHTSPLALCEVLRRLGISDITPRTRERSTGVRPSLVVPGDQVVPTVEADEVIRDLRDQELLRKAKEEGAAQERERLRGTVQIVTPQPGQHKVLFNGVELTECSLYENAESRLIQIHEALKG